MDTEKCTAKCKFCLPTDKCNIELVVIKVKLFSKVTFKLLEQKFHHYSTAFQHSFFSDAKFD